MPTYQYACKACGEGLEVVQGFHDDPLTECPACGGPLRKVFSSVGVVFKGSGFYRTDSRSAPKSDSGAASDSSSSSSAGAAKPDKPAPAETKAAAKPASGTSAA